MTEKRYAVIIGVDDTGVHLELPSLRYAKDDAQAIANILCDEDIGTFDLADMTLFVGADADAESIKEALWTVVREADDTDTLVLFFAGHTLALGEADSEVYLVTHDLDPKALSRNPDAGLGMNFLRRHVLGAFRGTAVVILDCCRAGSLVGHFPNSDFDLISRPRRGESQSFALMACANDGYAREAPALGHGLLTHHVLQALRGHAADDQGRVTMYAVAKHVLDQRLEPQPGVTMQSWGATMHLTTPGFRASSAAARHAAPAQIKVDITPLEGPLDRYADVVSGVITRLVCRPAHAANDAHVNMVDRLKTATGAKSVALLERGPDGFTPIDRTNRFDLEDVQPLLKGIPAASRLWFGHLAASEHSSAFCMPVDVLQDKVVLLAFVDMPPELIAMGQVVAKVLETVWTTNPENQDEAEIEVLTALRRTFGRLPDTLYERCLRLYEKVLESFVMAFQPVIAISADAQGVGVHSYEALARRKAGDPQAPIAMLQIAQDWGDSFKVVRDSIIVRKALVEYAEAHHAGPWSEDLPKPVSVNVSVRSLLDDTYVSAVQDAIVRSGLEASHVTLEISEQDPIEKRRGERWRVEPHTHFHQRLVDLACRVGVSFAVDDFGVGHATLSRVAELPLTQIKTDRAMLHHPLAAAELALVVQLARDPLNRGTTHIGRAVIVEGVDEASPLTLKQIFELKVKYVQGYITRTPASPELKALPAEIRQDIAARVRGDNDKRPTSIAGRNPAGSELPLRRGA